MRKSEANLLLDYLEETYEGPLSLHVVNLRSLGFQLPPHEFPYFVIGREQSEQGQTNEVFHKQREVVVWDQQSGGWSVRKVQEWEISRAGKRERGLFIYDTRKRQFVAPERFQIPEEPL